MIEKFSVRNFLSFKDEITLSFEASKSKDFEDLYCVNIKNGIRLLKLGILFGPNASGKTNVLKALDFLRHFLIRSKPDKTDPTGHIPFLLDEESKDKPGSFFLSFFVGETRYRYTVEMDKNIVYHEKLVYFPSSQPALFFEREYNQKKKKSEIEFGNKLGLTSTEKKLIEGLTISNSSVLSVFPKVNIKESPFNEVYDWFYNGFQNLVTPNVNLTPFVCSKAAKDPECKKMVLEVLQKADFNIDDILFKERKVPVGSMTEINEFNLAVSEDTKDQYLKDGYIKATEYRFTHKTSKSNTELPQSLESSGTKRYYGLGGLLLRIVHPGTFMMIDELENSLHIDLVSHFLKTFLANAKHSQLLVTTHDIHLLGEDFLRRDSIWFTEKNHDGESELFSLLDFKLHKNLSPYNAYRVGKLGAKPQPGSIFLDNE